MNWLDAICDLFDSRRDSEERPLSSDSRFGTTDVLECRLVLGALSADTALPTSTGTSSSDSSTTSIDASQSIVSGSTSSISPSQSSLNLTSSTSTSSTGTTETDGTDTSNLNQSGTTVTETGLGSLLEQASATDSSNSVTSSIDVPNVPTGASSSTGSSTASVGDNGVIATESAPLTSTDPATVQSPPPAIDNALTAVNRNVMVSSDLISGSGAVSASANVAADAIVPAWFGNQSTVSTIHYDFRDENGVANQITSDQIAAAEQVLNAWSQASGGKVQFVRDTQASVDQIVNIGVGDLSAVSSPTDTSTTLGTSRHSLITVNESQTSVGAIWLNGSQTSSSYDFKTVIAHEVGHVLGVDDDATHAGIMNPIYAGEQDLSGIASAWANPVFYTSSSEDANGFITDNMADAQLSADEVTQLLKRASEASPSENAIIAVVDRNGNILGVRVEQGVLDTIKDQKTLAFAIDGAISKARTAAFFSNDATAVTSRTVETLSATTILQREVEANPNADPANPNSTTQGPGFVAPIGIGGHFPAGIEFTPPVDLFNIESSNRDSTVVAGTDRFNIDPANVPAGNAMTTPISWGTEAGIAGATQNRGIATLPGGIPIYRDPNHNGVGATLIGGIGVFFPGEDGYATHEQGFVPDQGQTTFDRMNTTLELEAEAIAFAAVGGSPEANLVIGNLGPDNVKPLENVDVLFENITLKGILLPVAGSTAGLRGLRDVVSQFAPILGTGTNSGADQVLSNGMTSRAGQAAPSGWLVTPHLSPDSALTIDDMNQIINNGIAAANRVRATLRVQPNEITGQQDVRMTFAISDSKGNILAMYRMDDGTVFSEDVAVAKARNVAYYNDPTQLQSVDQVNLQTGSPEKVAAGTSFTNRTFRFLAEPRYPAGIDGSVPPEAQFSILNDAATAGIDPETGENLGAAAPVSAFTTVMGHDVFNPGTNFHDTSSPSANQNGIIFFPGSTSIYKNGKIVGGLGVSGDGVNQDDVVTFLAAQGYLPQTTTTPNAPPADNVAVDGVRLPYINFTRNPFG